MGLDIANSIFKERGNDFVNQVRQMIFNNLRMSRSIINSIIVYFIIVLYILFTFQYTYIIYNPIYSPVSIICIVILTIGLPFYWEKRIVRSIEIQEDRIIITRIFGIKKRIISRTEVKKGRYWPKQKSIFLELDHGFVSYSFESDPDFYGSLKNSNWKEIFIEPTITSHKSKITRDGIIWSCVCFALAIFLLTMSIIFRDNVLTSEFRRQIYMVTQIVLFTIFVIIVGIVFIFVGRYSIDIKKNSIELRSFPWDSSGNELFSVRRIRYRMMRYQDIEFNEIKLKYGWGKNNQWILIRIETKEGDVKKAVFTPKDCQKLKTDLISVYGKGKVTES